MKTVLFGILALAFAGLGTFAILAKAWPLAVLCFIATMILIWSADSGKKE